MLAKVGAAPNLNRWRRGGRFFTRPAEFRSIIVTACLSTTTTSFGSDLALHGQFGLYGLKK
jgi:hypothetical protein